MKLPFRSVHDRVALVTSKAEGAMLTEKVPPALEQQFGAAMTGRYFPMLAFSAVLPLPKTSNATPALGSMSLKLTPLDSGKLMFLVGVNGLGPTTLSGNDV